MKIASEYTQNKRRDRPKNYTKKLQTNIIINFNKISIRYYLEKIIYNQMMQYLENSYLIGLQKTITGSVKIGQ